MNATLVEMEVLHIYFALIFCSEIIKERIQLVTLVQDPKKYDRLMCIATNHARSCEEVIYGCSLIRQCYEDYVSKFRSLDFDSSFDCLDEEYKPPIMYTTLTSSVLTNQVIPLPFPTSSFNLVDSQLRKCSRQFPSIMANIRPTSYNQSHVICHEIYMTPNGNCRNFRALCQKILDCSLTRVEAQCNNNILVLNQADLYTDWHTFCNHWANDVVVSHADQYQRFITNCSTSKVLMHSCDFQDQMCNLTAVCIQNPSCAMTNFSRIDLTPKMHSHLPLRNTQNVFKCNLDLGAKYGISLSVESAQWICQTSVKMHKHALTCDQIAELCDELKSCIESEAEVVNRQFLDVNECESPMDATRREANCLKLPLVIDAGTSGVRLGSFLRDCSISVQDTVVYQTEPRLHDTCCQQIVFSNTQPINCSEQATVCNDILRCFYTFEDHILPFLELVNSKTIFSVVSLSCCVLGLICDAIILFRQKNIYLFAKCKIILELCLFCILICTSILELMNNLMPIQVRWAHDSLLNWFIYVILSLHSLAVLIDCMYLALITKYPFIVNTVFKILGKILIGGVCLTISYHIPRFFLDLSISSSVCSIYHGFRLHQAYELEYFFIKQQIEKSENWEGFAQADSEDYFKKYHANCYSYYQRMRSSAAFLVYNEVADGIFCHVVPTITVIASFVIFVSEIQKVLRQRQSMNVTGKSINVWNKGTISYLFYSTALVIRHSIIITLTAYIWHHDNDNFFLISTTREVFFVYVFCTTMLMPFSGVIVLTWEFYHKRN